MICHLKDILNNLDSLNICDAFRVSNLHVMIFIITKNLLWLEFLADGLVVIRCLSMKLAEVGHY